MKRNGGIEMKEFHLLTPSADKFPIIAHLVTTILVSGKIALSHAPSLLNSSARPCHAQTFTYA